MSLRFLVRGHSCLFVVRLTGLGFQPLDFFLEVAVDGLCAKFFQIGVFGKPCEIAVAEAECFFQGAGGAGELFGERVAAREVVKDERVLRFEVREAFVHLQPFRKTSTPGVVIAEELERVHIIWIAADDALHEFNPRIEIALGGAAQFFSGGAFNWHTTGHFFQAAQPSQAGASKNFVELPDALSQIPIKLNQVSPDL
jgi:hypothetical protein